ncbi:uncharacterized protein LOC111716366 isoform X2 [Eurytemora carolleeae]|uniref:uncharacterized protein LOC111716366 isoform X2 n=1 Tax=Eurytemora carolleeae TaxID=1294199 RepID=UPI000C75A554|nr:uncharacterized protein LOC111716366 isoform X2 [Eurytemora carolleeae]|eukprot:XP_023347579.1 uncharacterized protein LOC111716366 isoform X2 [Eurytemora affinis]
MEKYINLLIKHTEGRDVMSLVHWILSSLGETSQKVYLENVLEILVDSFCFKNQDILKIALQISSQIDRPDLMDLMLSSSYIQNIPNLSKDVRIFICKLSWNIALSKSGYLEKFRLFLLAAEILTDVSSSQVQQAVYVSALSAGLRALECGYEEVREELFQTMKSLTESEDLLPLMKRAILVFQFRFSLLTHSYSSFNLRSAILDLQALREFEILAAVGVMVAEKNERMSVDCLLPCLENLENPGTGGLSILELMEIKPQQWPHIDAVFSRIKDRTGEDCSKYCLERMGQALYLTSF